MHAPGGPGVAGRSDRTGDRSSPLVLGLDLGTTEAKAGLFDLDGRPVGLARRPLDGGATDPDAWWAAITAAVADLPAERGDSAAVCAVAQGPTLAVLDAAGGPVRPAIGWLDRRSGAGFGLLPRIEWLAEHDAAALDRARWLLGAWDALGLRLSGVAAWTRQWGEATPDPVAVARTGATGRVPAAIQPGDVLGGVTAAAASALGLREGTPVVAGANDGLATVVGSGLLEPGDGTDTGGTSGGLAILADRPVERPGVFSAPAPQPGRWIVGGAMAALGASLDWLATRVLQGRPALDDLLTEAAAVAPGADGLVFLPYLAGERSPVWDDDARGAFAGLTLSHGRGHLVRAVLEASAFALRHLAGPIRDAGVPLRSLRVAAGPARQPLGARIRADVLGVPVVIPRVAETAVLGAAILAAAGAGLAPDLRTATARMTGIERTIQPDPAAAAAYDRVFSVYERLWPALAPVSRELAAMSRPAAPGGPARE